MQYRQLGDSDLEVSEISLGSWLTMGVGVERKAAEDCLAHAFELGINFIDTANVYGMGAAETVLGEMLQGRDRASYVLATKLFFPMSPEDKGLSKAQIHKQIDASLARLKTDYVDLYQCHRYDTETPIEETMEAFTEVIAAGKVRYIGFSEWGPAQIQASLDLRTDQPATAKFVSSQPQYSILWRRPQDKVMPLCRDNGISQIVWSPLAQGVLTGKYEPGKPPPPDSRAASPEMGGMMDRWRSDAVLESVVKLKPIAADLGVSMAQLALAWVLRDDNVASAIIGASRPSQVDDNCAASGMKLSEETCKRIDDAVGELLGRSE